MWINKWATVVFGILNLVVVGFLVDTVEEDEVLDTPAGNRSTSRASRSPRWAATARGTLMPARSSRCSPSGGPSRRAER
ncbi:hypothetical protein [Streptomyces sp. CA2R106]|uniref:hypothetical protein n=1 Tax=Streptomyces sp. CA2R106 TaxID=3120153 RepID=UPI003FA69F5D